MLRVALAISLALLGCTKASKDSPKEGGDKPSQGVKTTPDTKTDQTSTKPADGPRKVAIEVNKDGYNPDRIPGKPGEKLTLVFTRTFESECISQVKAPDGKLVDLPMNKAVEVAVTVPQQGDVQFACGMDMVHGTIVAEK